MCCWVGHCLFIICLGSLVDQWETLMSLRSMFHCVAPDSMESIILMVISLWTIDKFRITLFHKNGVFLSHCLVEIWSYHHFCLHSCRFKMDMRQCANHSVGFVLGSLGQSGPLPGLSSHSVLIEKAEAEETMLAQIFAFLIAYRWRVVEVLSLPDPEGLREEMGCIMLEPWSLWHMWISLSLGKETLLLLREIATFCWTGDTKKLKTIILLSFLRTKEDSMLTTLQSHYSTPRNAHLF